MLRDIRIKNIIKIIFAFVFAIFFSGGDFQKVSANGEPSTPANLVATQISDTEINLTWDRVGTGETSITVWRLFNSAYEKVTVLPTGSNIFTDTSLYPATEYSYQLTADNSNGSSSPTTTVVASTKTSGAAAVAAANFSANVDSPYSISLSWDDANTMSRSWFLERSIDGVSYVTIKVIGSSSTSVGFVDTPLLPSTTYYYRTRLITGYNYSDYNIPVSATTQVLPDNVPTAPTNFSAVVNSATSATLNWTDSNNGSATYIVETAPFAWSPTLPTWTQVAETATGVTTYNLTTTAEKFYYIRIKAKNGSGNSGYSSTVKIRTASPGTGSAKIYEIGPDKTYASLGAFDWASLGPGDTVNIYPNKDGNGNIIPYYEKPMISVRGTAAKWITIQGVPDLITGQRPIIDGTNAVENSQWNRSYLPIHDTALILVSYRQGQNDSGWSPGYFSLENLEIRNGYGGDPETPLTYTAFDGSTRTYGHGCGIYFEKGDHITIKNNIIHDNNQGLFGAGQGDQRNFENILIDSNYIYGNGTVDGDRQHNTYLEGINVTYQFNKYGKLRTNSFGSGLKDRGAGTIIRYNWIQDGGHLIDMVEAQNYQSSTAISASYNETYVYGNVLYNLEVGATTPIHYGGDGGVTPSYRKGILYFYNNTYVNHEDKSDHYYVLPFKLSSSGESLDARNNIIAFFSKDTAVYPEIRLTAGAAYFGKNWISDSWYIYGSGNHIAGTENFINNVQNDPGFINKDFQNFRLSASSQNVDQSEVLPANVPSAQYFYSEPHSGGVRDIAGDVADMGAFEYNTSDFNPPASPSGLSID